MANYFVDSTTGSDTDNGTTMDLAWATLKHALEASGLSAGDWVWVRRIHVEYSGSPTSDIAPIYSGTPEDPIRVVGWPRNTFSITSATWTNGSTTVDLILPASMDREKHCGRYVTAPDGRDYLITKITDTNTFLIDREYAGATVNGPSGAATIKADEDYSTAQAIDDSGWTITKATYNADADDLPCIDFKDTAYQLYVYQDNCFGFFNLEFRDSTDDNGCFSLRISKQAFLRGCLFHQDNNDPLVNASGGGVLFIERCILEGNSTGTAQQGLSLTQGAIVRLKDVAIYSMGKFGIMLYQGCSAFAEGLNLGVEGANGDAGINLYSGGRLIGRDVKIDDTGGTVDFALGDSFSYAQIENYNRILGAHKTFTPQGEITKKDVVSGSGDPQKRSGGADSVVELLYNLSDTSNELPAPIAEWTPEVLTHEFEATTDSKSYRYYVQSQAALTAAQMWIECEYVAGYDDTSEYHIKTVQSDEAISVRSGTTDWSQYLEVTGIQPAVASKVRIRLKCRYQHATNKIFVDPKVVIS